MPVVLFRFGLQHTPFELDEQRSPTGDEKEVIGPTGVAAAYQFNRNRRNQKLLKSAAYHRSFDTVFLPPTHQNLHGPPFSLLNAHRPHH